MIEHVVNTLSGWVWGWPSAFPLIVALLLSAGLFVTLRLGFIQVRAFRHAWDVVRGRYDDPAHAGDISHFQALTTALSATVGIGNIAGVATAIHYGGPGALFWMWVTAFFGMALKYVECTLSMQYRVFDEKGEAAGGPMYYIERGLGKSWKPLAIAFAFLGVSCSFGSGNMNQANTVSLSASVALGAPAWITGVIMAALVGLVIIGGIRRIGAVSSKLAPAMFVLYSVGGVIILAKHLGDIPAAFALIVREAFQPTAGLGGTAAGVFMTTLVWGVKRGLFSNEAGQGSAPIAHAAAKTDKPVREGVVAMLGPFIDTILICSLTGLVIVLTGTWNAHQVGTGDLGAVTVHEVDSAPAAGDSPVLAPLADGTYSVNGGMPQGIAFETNDGFIVDARLVDSAGEAWNGSLEVALG
ncbi:MAG: sodium:alanine symporter family protein, partial [Gemmatimonadetes bacterium]|nr:sodium:alanine symporter family protein [Gemmatimonadota bacterium]